MSNIRITQNGMKQRVEIDGHDVSPAVRSLTVGMSAHQILQVELELTILHNTEVEADNAWIKVSDASRELLIAAGWTPPADAREVRPCASS